MLYSHRQALALSPQLFSSLFTSLNTFGVLGFHIVLVAEGILHIQLHDKTRGPEDDWVISHHYKRDRLVGYHMDLKCDM